MEDRTIGLNEDGLLQMFLNDINKIPLLSREEEYVIAKRAKAGDQEAIDLLIESNLRFVIKITLKLRRPGLPLMDMISEGCRGIIKAVKTYDPERGFRFLSYAGDSIKQCIIAAIRDHHRNNHDSLDAPAFEGDEGESEITYKDLLESDDPGADQKYFDMQVFNLLGLLSEREKKVLELHFWHDKTFEEIGSVIGLTKDRIRQIEVKALSRLKWSIQERNGASRDVLLNRDYNPLRSC